LLGELRQNPREKRRKIGELWKESLEKNKEKEKRK